MKEENWYKFLVVSTILHVFVIGALSIPIRRPAKRFDLSSTYSVGLVGDVGGGGGRGGVRGSPKAKALPEEPKARPEKPTAAPKTKKQVAATTKSKPVPVRLEKEAVSLSKKRVPQKETPTREELSRLEARIRDMKRRTAYIDVSKGRAAVGPERWGAGGGGGTGAGGGGLPGSGDGGGRPLDPTSQRYLMEVWERIKNAWGLPGTSSSKRNLETIVTIKIRKDGKVVDINVEKRSGNRVYDESILRVLRSVDLPPIPSSLNMDSMEIGFRFLPGELS
jgi:TonB family protein